MGWLRDGHNWVTSLSLSCIGEGNGNPLQCSCLENPRDGGAWWAAICGVAQSQTQLKRPAIYQYKVSPLWYEYNVECSVSHSDLYDQTFFFFFFETMIGNNFKIEFQ